jgi:hypothetical protein
VPGNFDKHVIIMQCNTEEKSKTHRIYDLIENQKKHPSSYKPLVRGCKTEYHSGI